MTVYQEHNAKVLFLKGMKNKYDYSEFKQFCEDSGFEVLPFAYYPVVVAKEHDLYELDDNGYPVDTEVTESVIEGQEINYSIPAVKSCCGGGEIK